MVKRAGASPSCSISPLRYLTAQTAQAVRAMIDASRTSPPVLMSACRSCSMESADGRRRMEHVGAKSALDLEGPLVFLRETIESGICRYVRADSFLFFINNYVW